ncbi:nuclear RNA export factor 1-like [Lagopus leucura]|uniref:nuclear RNA export factor 1-like n=1 Tax=Lagopus leucura TaxID=30410 RepID=UPI001C6660D0|nr:nuclear RNA export factor 1-like [Lagopus leucura]
MQVCMSKRYDGSQRALDLKGLRVDPDLVSQSIDAVLNQRSCMMAVLRIIEENIPELQSLNLSSNKLYRLDDLSELAQKAAGLKILDLSRNEVRGSRSPTLTRSCCRTIELQFRKSSKVPRSNPSPPWNHRVEIEEVLQGHQMRPIPTVEP